MADITPPTGGAGPIDPSTGPEGAQPGKFDSSKDPKGWEQFKSFLGKKDFEMFMKNLCMNINREIQKIKEKQHKTAMEIKKRLEENS